MGLKYLREGMEVRKGMGWEYLGEGGWSTEGLDYPGEGCWYKGVRELRQSLDTPQAPEGLREHVWIQSKREFSKRARIKESEKRKIKQDKFK